GTPDRPYGDPRRPGAAAEAGRDADALHGDLLPRDPRPALALPGHRVGPARYLLVASRPAVRRPAPGLLQLRAFPGCGRLLHPLLPPPGRRPAVAPGRRAGCPPGRRPLEAGRRLLGPPDAGLHPPARRAGRDRPRRARGHQHLIGGCGRMRILVASTYI